MSTTIEKSVGYTITHRLTWKTNAGVKVPLSSPDYAIKASYSDKLTGGTKVDISSSCYFDDGDAILAHNTTGMTPGRYYVQMIVTRVADNVEGQGEKHLYILNAPIPE